MIKNSISKLNSSEMHFDELPRKCGNKTYANPWIHTYGLWKVLSSLEFQTVKSTSKHSCRNLVALIRLESRLHNDAKGFQWNKSFSRIHICGKVMQNSFSH